MGVADGPIPIAVFGLTPNSEVRGAEAVGMLG